MTRIDFYHLQRTPLDAVLPKLCEKAYSVGNRIKIWVDSEERVETINNLLWTYKEDSFLPHGSKKDGFAEEQPIFISSNEKNENNADLLILADGVRPVTDILATYTRVLNIFDGNDGASVQNARIYWKEVKAADFEVHYWQQNISGGFEQKA